MDPLEAIIFPQTLPIGANFLPLVHFFDTLVYCAPVEGEDQDEFQGKVDDNHCRYFSPAPLGDDRERFLSLVQDLEGKRDHYAEQLGHLSLAGFTQSRREVEETKGAIITDLLRPKDSDDSLQEKKMQILWQARLVLKLGEMYDQQQQSLQDDMRRVLDQENSLFGELRQEEDISFAFTRQLSGVTQSNSVLEEHRLKAWVRLFVLGSASPTVPAVFVTSDRRGLDYLVEKFEAITNKESEGLTVLLLPPWEQDGVNNENEITVGPNAQEILVSLRSALVVGKSDDNWEKFAQQWNDLIRSRCPEEDCSRLTLFRFPKISANNLLMQAFGHSDELSIKGEVDNGPGMIAGVLE
ncbi:MAG: hypothetical protein OEM02_12195 [Desulfobulbaceae bacterium]|nr:hypothetical protein [Desulfobulbaceae bacterium]